MFFSPTVVYFHKPAKKHQQTILCNFPVKLVASQLHLGTWHFLFVLENNATCD